MLASGRVESVVVVFCDAAVHGEVEFRPGDMVDMKAAKGGGGTAFAPAFRHIAESHADAAAIVYLTDLDPYGPEAWGDEPDAPVLWAVIGPLRAAPFGRVLPVDPNA
jgi:predicted metal-dependent peptidase